jgi:uncharacterized protein YoxC
MSTKITDARIAELERLTKLKKSLQDDINGKKAEMQKILNSMNAESQAMASSSSNAVKERRGKGTSRLDHQDVIDSLDIAIERLEADYAKVDKELETLKKL